MYNHLTGAVARINSERLVIEVSGVGYHVTINWCAHDGRDA